MTTRAGVIALLAITAIACAAFCALVLLTQPSGKEVRPETPTVYDKPATRLVIDGALP